MNESQALYVHGTDPKEQDRLAWMNSLINERCLREMNLGAETKILDVGSGLGLMSREMARACKKAQVVGVEASPRQIATAKGFLENDEVEGRVDFRQGDAKDLPLHSSEWGSFDLAHTRYLLEHVQDPLAVVSQMAGAVRYGGRVILADDDHDVMRVWPESPSFLAAWRAYARSYDRSGQDPYVGRRLVSLIHQAGLVPCQVAVVSYGACSGMEEFEPLVDNFAQQLEAARERVIEGGLADSNDYETGIRSLRELAKRPDAAIWYTINCAVGQKK